MPSLSGALDAGVYGPMAAVMLLVWCLYWRCIRDLLQKEEPLDPEGGA